MTDEPMTNPTVGTKPNEVPIVPEDWAVLGMKAGYDPKPAEALRLFIVGPSGEGKTTFVSSIPRTMIFDFDDGANAVPGGRATRIHVRDYAHFDSIIGKLVADNTKGQRHWDRVAIDTIDELIAMIKHQLEEEKGVEDITEYRSTGYGYNMILQRFWSKMLDLEHAGYTWAVVGHVRTIEEVDPATRKPVTRIRESVYPGVAKKILTKSDFKVTIYYIPETKEVEGPPRIVGSGDNRKKLPGIKESVLVPTYYLNALTSEGRDNKSRGVPQMERRFEIPLCGGWDVFKQKYESAVLAERNK